jgi:hypothetical protein
LAAFLLSSSEVLLALVAFHAPDLAQGGRRGSRSPACSRSEASGGRSSRASTPWLAPPLCGHREWGLRPQAPPPAFQVAGWVCYQFCSCRCTLHGLCRPFSSKFPVFPASAPIRHFGPPAPRQPCWLTSLRQTPAGAQQANGAPPLSDSDLMPLRREAMETAIKLSGRAARAVRVGAVFTSPRCGAASRASATAAGARRRGSIAAGPSPAPPGAPARAPAPPARRGWWRPRCGAARGCR